MSVHIVLTCIMCKTLEETLKCSNLNPGSVNSGKKLTFLNTLKENVLYNLSVQIATDGKNMIIILKSTRQSLVTLKTALKIWNVFSITQRKTEGRLIKIIYFIGLLKLFINYLGSLLHNYLR